MKYFIAAALAVIMLNVAAAKAEPLAHAITAQEKAWAAALVAGDLAKVDALMHRDFRLKRVYGDAPPISKEMYLSMEGVSASAVEVTSVRIVHDAGAVVAARTTWSLDWTQEGVGPLPPHFDMIDIWMKGEDGVWRVLSRISQIADAPHQGGFYKD